ncbi:unnamed protein product [Paramecium sonneborni]|uniref:RING-type domain-containing protein n=1 Tax=Paramecium sonneborni TaxID=65129 RepID=A0A8S1R4I1_9CILI|nr:unnamed protein product [Paramecium sonneborni]
MKSQTKAKTSKNAPQIILDLIEQAKQTRLYLLKRIGPTSLKYCDEDGNKFKVELSTNMICSCNQNNSHCIHTIHALLKVFQVDEKCPILWQQQYSQYDITNILNGQYKTQSQQTKTRQQISVIRQQQQQQVQQNNNTSEDQQQNRQQITEDDMCPICQESLVCNEALVHCKKQCGNNFHAKCMKVWVMQKQTAGKKINCPMCRVDWGDTALVEIRQEEKIFENLHKTHNKICSYCKITPIIGTIYTCISCSNYHLCDKCHNKKTHQQHIFMFKHSRLEKYQFEVNVTIDSLMYLFPENLNAGNHETGGLMLVGTGFQKQSKCSFCYKQKQLRLLSCGHIADEICINKMKEHYYLCPIDNQPQYIGLYNNLTQEEKNFHMTETKKWIIQKEDEQNIQNHKLPPIGKHFPARPKQLSQKHFENTDSKSMKIQHLKQQQQPIKRQLSANRKQLDNPLYIKSVRSQMENII